MENKNQNEVTSTECVGVTETRTKFSIHIEEGIIISQFNDLENNKVSLNEVKITSTELETLFSKYCEAYREQKNLIYQEVQDD